MGGAEVGGADVAGLEAAVGWRVGWLDSATPEAMAAAAMTTAAPINTGLSTRERPGRLSSSAPSLASSPASPASSSALAAAGAVRNSPRGSGLSAGHPWPVTA